VATTIDARERDVQQAFEQARAIARGAATRTLHEVETGLWTALLTLGRAMIALYLARVVYKPRATDYVHGGARFVLAETASSDIGTRFGKVMFERLVGGPRLAPYRVRSPDRSRPRPVRRLQPAGRAV
jgi:hypothetical protein